MGDRTPGELKRLIRQDEAELNKLNADEVELTRQYDKAVARLRERTNRIMVDRYHPRRAELKRLLEPPAPEPEPEPVLREEVALESLTKAELMAEAVRNDVTLSSRMTKGAMLAKLHTLDPQEG